MDRAPKILIWGTYDLGKPRTRILLDGLRANGVDLIECHASVWSGVADKTQLRDWRSRLTILLRWLFAYPSLIWRFLRLAKHDSVLIPYMGHLDVLVLWPLARLRGSRVVWDVFISLYDTIVDDRKMFSARNPIARLIYGFEWLASRAADRMLLDTRTHAKRFQRRYGLAEDCVGAVLVGVETEHFPAVAPLAPMAPSDPITVLFYGQFIPLHGIRTIVDAARRLDDGSVQWILIGKGQEEPAVRRELASRPVENLEWVNWVSYESLTNWIGRADVCLGIFSRSHKAASVIPNKVFQVLASGRPLITRDSPAIRELVSSEEPGVYLVPPEDREALVRAIRRFLDDRRDLVGKPLFGDLQERITARAVGAELWAELGH